MRLLESIVCVRRIMVACAVMGFALTTGAEASGRWTSNGPEGGTILSLAIDPTDTSTLYAGTERGGVFKSTDGGDNWFAINNGLTKFDGFVKALAIDPEDTSTLYAGLSQGGVFKSVDGGASWVIINNGLNTPFVEASVLAIDPTNTSTLYAGTGNGLFKSTDGGANWVGINNGLTSSDVEILGIQTLAIDPTDTSTLYAGTRRGIFKTTNMGANWVLINFDLRRNESFAIDSTNTSILYAGARFDGVSKSTDGGANRVAINNGLNGGFITVYALVIDPTNTSVLYAGTFGGGVSKSTDGGANWAAMNNALFEGAAFVNALAMDPTNTSTLYAGTADGVFKSTDGAANWEGMNDGLTVTSVQALALDPTDTSKLYAGTFGGGVFVFRIQPDWLYAAGNPSGTEAQFDGLALTNFSSGPDTARLVAVSSTSGIASVQAQALQVNGNEAMVVLEAGQQTALLRSDLFEGDPDEPAWIELISDTGQIGTFFSVRQRDTLAAGRGCGRHRDEQSDCPDPSL